MTPSQITVRETHAYTAVVVACALGLVVLLAALVGCSSAPPEILRHVAVVPIYFEETPGQVERIDGRTVPTVIAEGGTVRIERIDGRPEAWMWDEDAVAALDEANGDA